MSEGLGGFDAQATYDEAALDYEDASRDFWQYLPVRTLARLALRPGERVLDVPCGSGPTVTAAAEQVGPSGLVVGVDYAEQMVAIAREKAARVAPGEAGEARRPGRVELRVGDMTTLEAPPEPYDAVLCSLGLFFADDMPALIRSFARLLRPGTGRMAVTVFGAQVFDPVRRFFVDTVAELAPGVEVLQPWRRTEDAAVLRRIFADADAGVDDVEIDTAEDRLALPSPADWWRIVMGSGFRRTVAALDEAVVKELRSRCDAWITGNGVTEIVNTSHCAVAHRR